MVSIDPGVEYYAWAVWYGNVLAHVGISNISAEPSEIAVLKPRPTFVMERPRIRTFGKRAPNPVVIGLTLAAGRLSDRARTEWVDAGVWTKGQSKSIRHPKTLRALHPDRERPMVLKLSKKDQDHVLDAIGIGLHYLQERGIR